MPWQQDIFIVFPKNGLPGVPPYGEQLGSPFEQQGYEHDPIHPAPGGVQKTVLAVAEDFADGSGIGREHTHPQLMASKSSEGSIKEISLQRCSDETRNRSR